jgi:alpha-galactosidase/6-phospho-beta-glucosidase family protein
MEKYKAYLDQDIHHLNHQAWINGTRCDINTAEDTIPDLLDEYYDKSQESRSRYLNGYYPGDQSTIYNQSPDYDIYDEVDDRSLLKNFAVLIRRPRK